MSETATEYHRGC